MLSVANRAIGAFAASAVCIAMPVARSASASPQAPVHIRVDGARPVSAAADEVESRFGRIVTYEDTSYVHPSELVDITDEIRRDGDVSKRVLGMRRGRIDVTFVPPSADVDEWLGVLLRGILAAAKAAGNAGEFAVAARPRAFHIVPIARKGLHGTLEPYASPLDAPLTLAYRDECAAEFIERFSRAVSVAAGRRVVAGMFPTNLFVQRRIALSAQGENARDVLWRALQTVRRDLSWRLLCDVGENADCAINIRMVERYR